MVCRSHGLAQHSKDVRPGGLGHVVSAPFPAPCLAKGRNSWSVSPQPHVCVQYEILEAAQLAIESLDGILIDGIRVKVGGQGRRRAAALAGLSPSGQLPET